MNTPTVLPDTDLSQPFWQGLRERRLMLQFDQANGRAQFYPRPQSLTSEAGLQWRQASGRGKLFALTLSRVAPPALEALVPYPLALVQLDEGPRLMARIQAPYDSLSIGQSLEIDWDATGHSFPVFKPA